MSDKDIRNLFRLEKENKATKGRTIIDIRIICIEHGDIRNSFRFKKIENRILRDIKSLFEHEDEENYYKPVRVSNFWSNDYIEYESKCDRNKTLTVEKYLIKLDHT